MTTVISFKSLKKQVQFFPSVLYRFIDGCPHFLTFTFAFTSIKAYLKSLGIE